MSFNINAGRLRHIVNFWQSSGGSDDYGDPLPSTLLLEGVRAEVQVKSGDQFNDYGTTLTTEVITVLTWFDPRINNSLTLEWNSIRYQIQHVRTDTEAKSIVITATVERKNE